MLKMLEYSSITTTFISLPHKKQAKSYFCVKLKLSTP